MPVDRALSVEVALVNPDTEAEPVPVTVCDFRLLKVMLREAIALAVVIPLVVIRPVNEALKEPLPLAESEPADVNVPEFTALPEDDSILAPDSDAD